MTSRPIIAIALGALIGLLLSGFLGWLGDYVFPPSVLADMNPQLARTMPMPIGEIVTQLLGWGGGTVVGSIMAMRFAGEDPPWISWSVAGALALACAALAFVSPHPFWFVALCLIVIAGAGFFAGRSLGIGDMTWQEPATQPYAPAAPVYAPEPQHYEPEPEPQAYEPAPEPEPNPPLEP